MLQVRDDNAAAFEELVLRYQSRLLTVLEHLVNDPELAEDLAQETFLRVYRARKSYSPNAKFVTWLFTIATNLASNARRQKSRRKEIVLASSGQEQSTGIDLASLALAASGLMPTRQIDKTELAQVVRAAMDALTDQQRTALLLSRFEEMSYVDIAQSMGMSVQAIKSLLWRARESLRVILEPYMQEGQHPQGGSAS
ncbi:MAG: sigma-70 family RNA polymerase sigma factor [Planctomycetes bacterium]|nr:sigma-70 family RNA polymerase sigma factor [Planctomycetota bacterium]